MLNESPVIEFVTETGIPDEVVRSNVRHALSLGLPTVQKGAVRPETLHMYANGPSAKGASLQWPCMALNGALGLFEEMGPTYWAAMDAGEIVASFVSSQWSDYTSYLVASKCHPKVFEALKCRDNGLDVHLWHVADVGASELPAGTDVMPTAPSITITAMFLAHYMGYRKVIVYGWDGCYGEDGEDHAVPQPHNRAGDIDIEYDGRTFKSSTSWACEAEDASIMMGMLSDMDITIVGDGFFANVLRPFTKAENDINLTA